MSDSVADHPLPEPDVAREWLQKDAFFEAVLVNSDDPEERANRLRLLVQVRDAMGQVADFSQVSG